MSVASPALTKMASTTTRRKIEPPSKIIASRSMGKVGEPVRVTGAARAGSPPRGRGSMLISRLAAAGVYVGLGQRAVQSAIFQLATAGINLFASQGADQT